MSRSLKKGPFADGYLLKKVDAVERVRTEDRYKDLVTPLHYLPFDGRTYDRCS